MQILKPLIATGLAIAMAANSAQAQISTVRVASGLSAPVYVTGAPGDFDRLFIVEQAGRIRILENGSLSTFLNITSKVAMSPFSEQGLLCMAFHPDYETNGFFYVSYTSTVGNGDSVIERYSVSANPGVANAGSAVMVAGPVNQPQSNHNGGCIQFGPDGHLFWALGDGGNFNDTGGGHVAGGNSQSGTQNLGKMHRYDVDIPFPHIPADNPFVGNGSVNDSIWSTGLRNPWRFSFDRETGDMYIADVGQGAREEINVEEPGNAGRNYGWRCMEGFNCTGLSGCVCNSAGLTLPIDDYNHGGGKCSITGGYVYRGCSIPSLDGTYFFADLCTNQIWSWEYTGSGFTNFVERTSELTPDIGSISTIASFGEDTAGEMYIVELNGEIFKIVNDSPSIVDCNANEIDDACEIALGTAQDINQNGIPDSCECPDPMTYCIGKLNSRFCLPVIDWTGTPIADGSAPFTIEGAQIVNSKNGLLFYGFNGQASLPFQGGILCVNPPLRRTPITNAGGSLPNVSDCTGTFSFDMAAWVSSGTDPFLVTGATVNAQFWFRDPADPFGIGLTDALEFVLCDPAILK